MADQNKQISFKLAIDESSARRAVAVVRDLSREINKLVENIQRINLNFGKGGGGGLGNVQMSSMGTGGKGFTSTASSGINIGGYQSAGGIAGGLVSGVQAVTQAYKGHSEGVKGFFKETTDAVRRASKDQANEISEVTRALKDLKSAYDDVKSFKFPKAARGSSKGGMFAGDLFDQRIAEFKAQGGGVAPPSTMIPGMFGGGEEGGYGMKGLWGDLTQRRAMGPGFKTGLGIAALLVGGAGALANEVIKQPFDFINQGARSGNLYGGAGLSARYGDMRQLMALKMVAQDPNKLRDFVAVTTSVPGKEMSSKEAQEWALHPWKVAQSSQGPTNIVSPKVAHNVNAVTGGILGAITSLNPNIPGEVARRLEGVDMNMKEAQMTYLQKVIEENPLQMHYAQRLQGEAMSRLGAQRAMGSRNAMDIFASFQGRGIDSGAVSGMFAQLDQAIGRSNAYRNLSAGLGYQAGGLHGFAQMMAAAAQSGAYVNGGRGGYFDRVGGFTTAVANFAGMRTGGLDVAAANQMGMTAAGGMMDQAAMTSGLGYLGALGAASGGRSAGEQMRIQGQLAQGAGAMGGVLAGATDPWQHGMNLLSAIDTFKGIGVHNQSFVASKLTPRLALDIINGAAIPEELRVRGITSKDQVRQFYDKTVGSLATRYVADTGDLTTIKGQFAQGLIHSGASARDFAKQQMRGLTGKAAQSKKSEIIASYGGMLVDELGLSNEQAMGMARLDLFGVGAGQASTKGRKGRGASFSPGGAELSTAQVQAEAEKALNKELKDNHKFYEDLNKQLPQFSKGLLGLAGDMSKSADEVTNALSRMAGMINEVMNVQDPNFELENHLALATKDKASLALALKVASGKGRENINKYISRHNTGVDKDAATAIKGAGRAIGGMLGIK